MIMIRQAVESDEKALFLLAQNSPALEKLEFEAFQITFIDKIHDTSSYLGVAERNGSLVGYASGNSHSTFYANGRSFWLDAILVESDSRLNGIGRLLMDDVSSWCSKRDCKLVSLATNGAKEFYNALGYDDSARYFKKCL